MGKRGRPKKSQPPAKKTKRQEGERRSAASAGLSGQGIPESENDSSPPFSLPGLHVRESDPAHRILGPAAGEADLLTAGTIQPATMVAPTGQPPSRSRRQANSQRVTVTGAEGPAACGNDRASTSSGPLPTSLSGGPPNSAVCGGQAAEISDAASPLSSAPASRNQQRGDIAFTNLPAPTSSHASPPGPQRAPVATANDPVWRLLNKTHG
ncbi:synapsin-1-like [Acanthaster planci]|uniref:Synapsin-1-like n=1 Tax=Acanthaster planci TaxID=133434 RepID=A0A8B7ZP05_ACAPL|nr:synapsin-1-like [Acanthaster planci]